MNEVLYIMVQFKTSCGVVSFLIKTYCFYLFIYFKIIFILKIFNIYIYYYYYYYYLVLLKHANHLKLI